MTAVDDLGRILGLLVALPVSLLPGPWRRRINNRRPLPLVAATVVTGVLELFSAIALGVVLFQRYRAVLSSNADALANLDQGAVMGLRATVFLGFLFSFRGALCGLMMAEGVLRALSGAVMGEAAGSAPIAIALTIWRLVHARLAERRLGPLVVDLVSPGATPDERVIDTCRPRPWHEHTTLAYDGAFYRVVDCVVLPAGPRRLRYRLRELPASQLIRRPEPYRPDALLPAARPRAPARGLPTAALAPDQILREGDGSIRLETSAARDWPPRTTVEIDGECYEVTGFHEVAGRQVYRLRPVPPGQAIRGTARYP